MLENAYLYMHLATDGQANSSQCWLVDDSQVFLTGQHLVSFLFIVISTSFLNSNFLYHLIYLLFIEKLQLAIVASCIYYLCSYYPIKYVHGLHQCRMAKLQSTHHKVITANDHHPAQKGCLATKCVEVHVVASANV